MTLDPSRMPSVLRRWLAALALYGGIVALALIELARRGAFVGDAVDQLIEQLPNFYGPRHLWEPDVMLGYPQSAHPIAAFWYPLATLARLTHAGPNALEAAAYLIAALGTFGLVRALTRSTPAALAGGLIAALDGFMVGHAGHASIVQPAAWAPYVFWSLVEQRRAHTRGWMAVGAASFALTLLAGQPQVAAYLFFAALAYAIVSARIAERGVAPYAYAASATIALGLGLAAITLVPATELAAASTRANYTFEQFQEFTVPVLQLPIRLFLPYALGTTIVPPYAFSSINVGSFAEMSNYVGIITIVLATTGMMGAPRNADVRFWSALALVALVTSTGNQLGLAWLTYHIPLYNHFRAPGRDALELGLAAAVLGGFGIEGIASGTIARATVARALRRTAIAGALAAIVFLLMALLPPGAQLLAMSGSAALNPNPVQNAALAIPVVLLGLACATVWWWSQAPHTPLRTTALIATFALDLGTFAAASYWNYGAFPTARIDTPPLATELRTLVAPQHQRILTLPGAGALDAGISPNLNVLWDVPSLRGYTPLELASSAAFFESDAAASPARLVDPRDRTLDRAGVRFVLVPDEVAADPASPWHPAALVRAQPQRFRLIASARGVTVLENRTALPRAWIEPSDGGTATIDALISDAMRLHVTCHTACTLVTSDAVYPGWHATIDARETTIAPAYGALREIAVPAGDHAVTFAYRPLSLVLGASISGASALALLAFVMWPFGKRPARARAGVVSG